MTGPGWYRDPAGVPVDRWWDGVRWTSYTQPLGYEASRQQQLRSARATGALARLILWVVGIVVSIFVLVLLVALIAIMAR